jgi:hypothetical protein
MGQRLYTEGAVGFFSSLFGVSKMNADPDQQRFARMFIEAAEDPSMGRQIELTNWLIQQPWTPSETRNRIMHALSIVKVASVPAIYARAKEIGRHLHDASYQLG